MRLSTGTDIDLLSFLVCYGDCLFSCKMGTAGVSEELVSAMWPYKALAVQATYVQAFLCKLLCSTESVLQVCPGMDGPLIECRSGHVLHYE